MNSNWRTPEEAATKLCIYNLSTFVLISVNSIAPPQTPEEIYKASVCIASKCAHWLWRPCEACDTGTVISRDKDKLKHTNCQVCNGTGHDGSGLGRCGLIRG